MINQVGAKQRMRPAPLVSWVWALAVVATLLSRPPEILGIEVPHSEAFQDFNGPRLDAFGSGTPTQSASGPEPLRVVALGNSRLKHATFDDHRFGDFAAALGEERIAYLRIVNNWAVFKDFELLSERILSLEPDVVVLQLELLGLERGALGRARLTREYIIWRLAGFGPWNPRNVDQDELQFHKPCTNIQTEDALSRRLDRTYEWLHDDTAAESARLAREFIAKASSLGIGVILLGIPMTERMEQKRPSNPQNLLEIARELEAETKGVIYLNYPEVLPDDRYCDFVHMNKSGREEFSAWLVRELVRLARKALPQAHPQAAESPASD